jgi:hypothetical protein
MALRPSLCIDPKLYGLRRPSYPPPTLGLDNSYLCFMMAYDESYEVSMQTFETPRLQPYSRLRKGPPCLMSLSLTALKSMG